MDPTSDDPTQTGQEDSAAAQPMEFRASGMDAFVFLVGRSLLCCLTFGIYIFWLASDWKKWVARHTYVHGEQLTYDSRFGEFVLNAVVKGALVVVTLGLYLPWAWAKGQRYDWRCTRAADGRTCRFDGTGGGFFATFVLGMLLSVLTCGIGSAWTVVGLTRWSRSHLIIGGERARFEGSGVELFALSLVGQLLTLVTLGLYLPFHVVAVQSWIAKRTVVARGTDTAPTPRDPIEEAIARRAADPRTWYALSAAGVATLAALGLGVTTLWMIPAMRGPAELDLAELTAHMEAYGDLGPPPVLVLRMADAAPVSPAALSRLDVLTTRIEQVEGVGHVDSLARRGLMAYRQGSITLKPLLDLQPDERGSSPAELLETSVGRPLLSPDGVGSYLFVSFDGLGLQNPDAVRASVEQAVSPDDGSAAVSSYATWRDPLTDAFPAAASVYVYLAGSEEYLPRLRCAASLADAVERLSGVRSTTSAVNLVEMAAGHLGVDPSVEGMSRAQVAQLFLMLDMQSEDFMYQYVSLDRSMMLLVIAMNGDAEALSAVRATAAAFDCNGVTLTVL